MKQSLPPVDKRLQARFEELVKEHAGQAQRVAAGPRSLPGEGSAFARTQAAWRFFKNKSLSLPALAQPLLDHAAEVAKGCQGYCLVPHDWSNLDYRSHTSKKDLVCLGQKEEIGYELRSALLLSDQTGAPLAPLCQDLRALDGVHSSRHHTVQPSDSCLDELTPVMAYIADLKFPHPVVHIIDREADSVAHYRQWDQAGYLFLVRADRDRIVQYQTEHLKLSLVVKSLAEQQAFREVREVEWHGRSARQWLAEAEVTLDRPARRHRVVNGKKKHTNIPGPPLTLRLIVSRIYDVDGKLVAEWLLFTNLPAVVAATVVALWYYWRWRIESFFKLLKGAGQQLEHWQQETASAIARRLLVASMACVLVWQLAHNPTPMGRELRKLLIRLSGRQMKHGVEFTLPALLAGLWVLLAMMDVLNSYDLEQLQKLANLAQEGLSDPNSG